MKHYGKYFFLLTLLLVSFNGMAANKGLPYLRNFPATEYNAHNRNYDVVCDKYGNVFFANFEGLCAGPKLSDGRQVLLLVADSQNQYRGVFRDWFKTIVIAD